MPKPASTRRVGVRMTKAGPKVIETKKSKGLIDKALKKVGK